MNHKRLFGGLAVTSAIALAGVTASYAADATTRTNPMNSLVQAIATKFNLNEADVQQVFDDQHTAMETERKQAETDRLAEAVTAGNLTQAQADAITAKQAELEAERETMTPPDPSELENLTDAERDAKHEEMKAKMDAKRAELEQWAEDNDIPEEYTRFRMGERHSPGGPGQHGGGMMPDASQDQ